MRIKKRNGNEEIFDSDKIVQAVKKAYESVGEVPDSEELSKIAEKIRVKGEESSRYGRLITVEEIQDQVEIALIDLHCHDVLKAYILYRNQHQNKRQMIGRFAEMGYGDNVLSILKSVQKTYSEDYDLGHLLHKTQSFYKKGVSEEEGLKVLIKASLELTTAECPDWEYISSRFLRCLMGIEIDQMNQIHGIGSFYDKLKVYTDQGFYGSYLMEGYSQEEIETASSYMEDDRDALLNHSGLSLLYKRYLLRNFDSKVLETPQEMFLGIALHLAINEGHKRLLFVKDLYDILSTLKVTMATPTMSNARKPHHQLSSCFIDTVEDSLKGIYKSIDNFAQVSKSGGGMGLYFGKIRANGSDIRGYKGVAGGVIRWIKLANDTAVAVDQLGVRQGSVAVYLDVWHRDVPEFLQLKTNNGDDRNKAHDVFPGLCYPDLFWRLARKDINSAWYLMCPHEILSIKGYSLEDYYGPEWEEKYYDCVRDERIQKREISIKDLVRLIIKSAVETGTPFTFNRDAANNMNPNSHEGIIYGSNLCTEIMQNMSAITCLPTEEITVNGERVMVDKTIPGDFVVCNLASLVLGRIDVDDEKSLRQVIRTVVRALDNVIDQNSYPLVYAKHTNNRYRAIGLGVSGYHHMLATKGIRWESEEHLTYVDGLFEKINYLAIEASKDLAKEKGSYPLFEGSAWHDGSYFDQRGYFGEDWKTLKAEVQNHGLRNGYLLAVAPTGSTSVIAGTTAGTDPVMHKYFLEEKKGDILPRVAPDLSPATYWLYKSAHNMDQHWSLKAAGVRQKHIDQAQSLNLYVTTEHTMRQILDMYIHAWEEGIKTIYYIRSKSLEVEECASCSG